MTLRISLDIRTAWRVPYCLLEEASHLSPEDGGAGSMLIQSGNLQGAAASAVWCGPFNGTNRNDGELCTAATTSD